MTPDERYAITDTLARAEERIVQLEKALTQLVAFASANDDDAGICGEHWMVQQARAVLVPAIQTKPVCQTLIGIGQNIFAVEMKKDV